jgi:hypothetical protein
MLDLGLGGIDLYRRVGGYRNAKAPGKMNCQTDNSEAGCDPKPGKAATTSGGGK